MSFDYIHGLVQKTSLFCLSRAQDILLTGFNESVVDVRMTLLEKVDAWSIWIFIYWLALFSQKEYLDRDMRIIDQYIFKRLRDQILDYIARALFFSRS